VIAWDEPGSSFTVRVGRPMPQPVMSLHEPPLDFCSVTIVHCDWKSSV
jgi:hypothetical protein